MFSRPAIACLSLALLAGAPAVAQQEADDKCRPQLEAELASRGVSWDILTDPKWVPETQVSNPGMETVSGYQFYARPKSCTRGRLIARMDLECRITQIRTRGGCSVRALETD